MDVHKALEALQTNTADIIESEIDAQSLATRLYSAKLVGSTLYNSITDLSTGKDNVSRLRELVKMVRVSVKSDVESFNTFINVLKAMDCSVARNIAEKLEISSEDSLKEKQQTLGPKPSESEMNTSRLSGTTVPVVFEKIPNLQHFDSTDQKGKDPILSDASPDGSLMPHTSTVIGVHDQPLQYSSKESKSKSRVLQYRGEVRLKSPNDKIRQYQWELAEPGLKGENYIICAPTGSGKTLVAALIVKDHLVKKQKGGMKGQVLFVVKTQQLAHQQKNKLDEYLEGVSVIEITGETEIPIYSTLPQVDIIVCTSGKLYGELHDNRISLSAASLLVLDECHHAKGGDAYALIMEHYLLEKRKGLNPHVIGMTASPGAGRGKYPSIAKVVAHQANLCARLDATSGIRCVHANKDELLKFVRPPNHTSHELPHRDRMEPFLQILFNTMTKLEEMLPMQSIPMFDRCSPAYQQWIKNEIETAQLSGMDEQRDQISILELLDICVLALITYEDFEIENAMEILEEFEYKDDESLNETEKQLKLMHSQLRHLLSSISGYSNPLLKRAKEILYDHFSSKPLSKGIFFVRDIKHTDYVTNWIRASPNLVNLIKPSPITGYSRKGMTKEEQITIIEKFRSGEVNLLISTSVLEEGLDIPDCNMVIRFQIMSNEVADVQAEGRARAKDSTMHTIVISDSHIHHNQLINNDKKDLAVKAVQYLSSSHLNQFHIEEQQEEILFQREQRLKAEEDRKKAWNTGDVELVCRKCGSVACNATSICKYGTNKATPHYIVPSQSFIKEKMKKMKRKHPEPASVADFSRPHKIGCFECSEEWGVWGCWKNSVQYPLLKCTSFTFHNKKTEQRENCKKWKAVPFDILSYNEYNEREEEK